MRLRFSSGVSWEPPISFVLNKTNFQGRLTESGGREQGGGNWKTYHRVFARMLDQDHHLSLSRLVPDQAAWDRFDERVSGLDWAALTYCLISDSSNGCEILRSESFTWRKLLEAWYAVIEIL